MGQKAAELLLGRLQGERRANTVMFEPELIVRRSTCRAEAELRFGVSAYRRVGGAVGERNRLVTGRASGRLPQVVCNTAPANMHDRLASRALHAADTPIR